jgi:hypothetical protein
MSEDQPSEKVIRQRGASFPYLSLPEAVKIVRDAGSYGRQHSRSALATYAGHSTSESGPFKQKLAALREWGFILGSSDLLTLSDTAFTIAHPESPEDAASALLSAFKGCDVFWKIYEKAAKGTELTIDSLGNMAIHSYQINVASKAKFTQSLIDSAEIVGLAMRKPNGRVVFNPAMGEVLNFSKPEEKIGMDDSLHGIALSAGTSLKYQDIVVRQVWDIPQGTIVFEVNSKVPLGGSSYMQIAAVVTSIEDLSRTLGVNNLPERKDGDA